MLYIKVLWSKTPSTVRHAHAGIRLVCEPLRTGPELIHVVWLWSGAQRPAPLFSVWMDRARMAM